MPSTRSSVPALRIRSLGTAPVRPEGEYVVYWMTAFRRVRYNFALEHAVARAREFGVPLLVFEALRCGYRWASDRLHRFVIEGMAANARALSKTPVAYYPWLERKAGEGEGLLRALADRAVLVVGDDFPSFFLPRMVAAAAETLPVRLEVVDSNGLLPIRATDRVFKRAVDFRRHLQKTLAPHLADLPLEEPARLDGLVALDEPPTDITDRWPSLRRAFEAGDLPDLAAFPIDHEVAPSPITGGADAAGDQLTLFLEKRLHRYLDDRMDVDDRATSELSPYLHFGHMSPHEVFLAVTAREGWNPSRLGDEATAKRTGWWGLEAPSEAFFDELITWREVGYNASTHMANYRCYESLPEWARKTLEEHASDPRPDLYDLQELEAACTDDEIWNATQRELVRDGRIHNYLRMLWGKKIFEWSPSPRDALDVMIELNNKYALDGRNPNSYSGIFWCLGRYDRAWGPERPIYGKIRYMTSASTRRKMKLAGYLERYGPGSLSQARPKTESEAP